jgi:hypothetical protein
MCSKIELAPFPEKPGWTTLVVISAFACSVTIDGVDYIYNIQLIKERDSQTKRLLNFTSVNIPEENLEDVRRIALAR